jgi:hypothetical protein
MSYRDRFIEATLNKLSFVRWDRFAGENYYGWIDREDGKKDFIVIWFIESDVHDFGYVTSSSKYSKKICKLLYGKSKEGSPCQRIEDNYPNIKNVVKLIKGI